MPSTSEAPVEEEALEEASPEPRPRPWGPVVLVLLAAAAAGAVWYVARPATTPTARVPDVVRLAEREAAQRLRAAGFTVVVERTRSDDEPAGAVFGQEPPPGAELGSGAIATLRVASGPATTVVPDVLGLPAARAGAALRGAHLRVDRAAVFSSEAPGTVVAQDPAPGARTDWQAAVRVNVSRGSIRLTVPGLVGRTVAEARALVAAAGIPTLRAVPVGAAARAGTVVAQSPVGGSQIAGGDDVRVDVSDGKGAPAAPEPENPHTPALLGFGEREAVEQLEALGYRVRVRHVHAPTTREDGVVVEQEPAGGGPRGSVITLLVGDSGL